MKVYIFSSKKYDETFFNDALTAFEGVSVVYLPVKLTLVTCSLAAGADVVCCFVNDDLSAPVLESLHQLGIKLVALRCAGYNNVDLASAQQMDLTVCRVPEYSPFAVAEHAVALILDLNRNIHRAHNRVRENDYSLDGLMGFDLHGKTVGIVGFGKIGRAFANIMKGFGCNLLVTDPVAEFAEVNQFGELCDLPRLLQGADIISLHCPLTPATHHLIDTKALMLVKPGAMLINTSRGGLVDTPAVIKSLKAKHLGYLGIDVYEEEGDLFFEDLSNNMIQDDVFARLQTFPNVVITGHQGFFTKEALTKIATTTLENIDNFRSGNMAKVHQVLT